MDNKGEFRPLGLTELLQGAAERFVPCIHYNPHLDLLITKGRDASVSIRGAARGHVLDIGFATHPSWWRRMFRIEEVVSVQLWGAHNLCRQYKISDRIIPLQELVERVLQDTRATWVWSEAEKKRTFAYMRKHNFRIDWTMLHPGSQ